jgi:dTDP-glucose 4,6-dehydratase
VFPRSGATASPVGGTRAPTRSGSSSSIEFVALPQDDPLVRRPDITVAARDLGWTPQVDVADGLRRTIDWFRPHPDLVGIS